MEVHKDAPVVQSSVRLGLVGWRILLGIAPLCEVSVGGGSEFKPWIRLQKNNRDTAVTPTARLSFRRSAGPEGDRRWPPADVSWPCLGSQNSHIKYRYILVESSIDSL